jgi:predicted RNase H-like HicB family nuclease
MKQVDRYPKTVFWSDEDEGYIAIVPDLPGCSAFGETPDKALAEIEDAAEGWIEAAVAVGNPVPEPSIPRPEPQAGGRVLLRMGRTLHQKLIDDAKREGVSLNQHLVHLLSSASTANVVRQADTTPHYRLFTRFRKPSELASMESIAASSEALRSFFKDLTPHEQDLGTNSPDLDNIVIAGIDSPWRTAYGETDNG